MILMIDNYDSFTYSIVQYLGELGEQVEVYRNDEISLDEISELNPDRGDRRLQLRQCRTRLSEYLKFYRRHFRLQHQCL